MISKTTEDIFKTLSYRRAFLKHLSESSSSLGAKFDVAFLVWGLKMSGTPKNRTQSKYKERWEQFNVVDPTA